MRRPARPHHGTQPMPQRLSCSVPYHTVPGVLAFPNPKVSVTLNRDNLMRLLSRVVWSEGMYLGPHHFQAQSRYFEDSIQFATSSLWFASFGLVGVELDADALHNGTVSLVHARGIFPDGLPFNMPESDALPDAASRRRAVSAHARLHHRDAGHSAAQDRTASTARSSDDGADARYLAETARAPRREHRRRRAAGAAGPQEPAAAVRYRTGAATC